MKLTKDEKDILDAWLSHPGYEIAKRFDKEQVESLVLTLNKTLDFSKMDEATIKCLRENQISMNAISNYFTKLKSLTSRVISPK